VRHASWPYPRSAWQRRDVAHDLLEQFPERLASVSLAVLQVLAQGRVPSLRKLRFAVRERLGRCSDGDVDAAVELLGGCLVRSPGPRGATGFALNLERLSPELLRLLATTTPQ
jgi:hypothetical protein